MPLQVQQNEKYLYPKLSPSKVYAIKCTPVHTLHVEESGNLNGIPVLFLHGGPGGRVHDSDKRYFDPKVYRIITYDQRGSGKSTPLASIEENTSLDLLDDIELIRNKFRINQWILFGGSWGSTLALLYMIKHPSKVQASVLRGIFLGEQSDLNWFYEGYGANKIYPDAYENFLSPLSKAKRGSIIDEYYHILSTKTHPKYKEAVLAWSEWEGSTLSLKPQKEVLDSFLAPPSRESISCIECHYFKHKLFIEEGWILKNAEKLDSIPTYIIHGRYDMICPLESAWRLHKKIKNSKLYICEASGHTASEESITLKLLEIMDKLKLIHKLS